MADQMTRQNKEDIFDGDVEREQIRRIGEGMNRLAAHWAYLGDFRGGRSSKEFWAAKHRLQNLCGVKEAGDEPDFVGNMEGKSLQSLEKSVDAAIKAMKAYEERHNTFFGFLSRLFNLVSYARMQDTEIALRRLQEMKNSIVRLRIHGEDLTDPSKDMTEQMSDETKQAEKEKSAEKKAEKKVEKTAKKAVGAKKKSAEKQVEETIQEQKEAVDKPEEKTEEPEKKAEEPEKKAEESEKKTEEPEKKAEEPEKKAEEPEKKAEEPEKKAEEPEKKVEESEKKAEDSIEKIEKPQEPDDEPYEPAYDEKAELEFQKLSRQERSEIKESNGEAEFFKRYDKFIRKYPEREEQINSNKVEDLQKLNKELGKKFSDLEPYLEQRIKKLKMIQKLEKRSEENFKQRQTKAPQIEKNTNGETTKVILPDVTQPQLQHTLSGCWSVTLSSMLRQKGVEMDQETIRSFRPDRKIFTGNNLSSVNADRYNSIDSFRELIMKVLPDTALNSIQTSVDNFDMDDGENHWAPWTAEQKNEKRDEFKNKMRAVFKRSLETDKGSLALLMKDHYQTVYGYEKVTENGKEEEYVYLHDPNNPDVKKMTLDELAESGYKVEKNKDQIFGEQYSFDAQWLQNLTNDKGELTLDAGLTGKGVTYKDHELKCDKLVTYSNHADVNANWKTLNHIMEEDISITTFLPTKVKNLAKNRVLDPIKKDEHLVNLFRNQRKLKPKTLEHKAAELKAPVK